MCQQIKPTEVFRQRELALLKEAEKRRLLLGRRVGARRTPKTRSTIVAAVLSLLGALVVASLMLAASSSPAHAATIPIVVNSTLDLDDVDTADGVCDASAAFEDTCTLRAAIEQANATSGADQIEFAIPKFLRDPNTGVATISPQSPLPPITEQVTIDGYSQPGASLNTKKVGDNAVLKIELDGTNVPSDNGLEISSSSGSVIRGLVINRFSEGILVTGDGSVGNRIEGNFIGTEPTGTADRSNKFDGVSIVSGASQTVVGGPTPDKRNVISGNDQCGLFINNSNANRIKSNYVGADKSGTKDLGNASSGVCIGHASGTTVGGKTAASRNVVSGNDGGGLAIFGSQGTKVLGNRIGTTASGTDVLGNHFDGVFIGVDTSDTLVGDGTSAGSNIIAFNGLDFVGHDGVAVDGSTGNEISRNSIFSNGGLGIDLLKGGAEGEGSSTNISTPNDSGDGDSGPNNLQNKPVLSSAKTVSGTTTIKGELDSNAEQTYTIEFYSNPKGTNEGKKFIGETSVTTRRDGLRSFTFTPAKAVAVGQTITATATNTTTKDTSEFSAPRKVVAS
jgi:parallel beta-helix repeat protein